MQVAFIFERFRRVFRSLPSPLRASAILSFAVLPFLASAVLACAQTDSGTIQPYDSIDRDAINYFGPGRETTADIPGPEIKIGILAVPEGSGKAEGEALIQAAQMALEDEASNALPGRHLALVVRDATGPWGRASREIVRLIFDDRAVALITFSDGNLAHLAEQVGNRAGVPVLTLSSDSTTTEINIPWLFRVVPGDTGQGQVFARNIYGERRLTRVLLVTERDHDGRVGGEAFQKAARQLGAPAPDHLEISSAAVESDAVVRRIEARPPEALVFWTGTETAEQLLRKIRGTRIHAPVYLCHKAAQQRIRLRGNTSLGPKGQEPAEDAGIWIAAPQVNEGSPLRADLARRYTARTGKFPTAGATEAYDAVRLVIIALREAGPNRARVRDRLAKVSNFTGFSGIISFDGAGNDRTPLMLTHVQ